jgi:hypothetical protein
MIVPICMIIYGLTDGISAYSNQFTIKKAILTSIDWVNFLREQGSIY